MTAIRTLSAGCRLVGNRAVVAFSAEGRWDVELPHEAALSIASALVRTSYNRRLASELPLGWATCRGETNDGRPLVVVHAPNGRHVELAPKHALAVGQALQSRAQAAEQHNCAAEIAEDQAILYRIGGLPVGGGKRIPLGLTAHPKILDEARKLAVTDDALRRYLPGGVLSASTRVHQPGVFHTSMPEGHGRLDPTKILPPPEPT